MDTKHYFIHDWDTMFMVSFIGVSNKMDIWTISVILKIKYREILIKIQVSVFDYNCFFYKSLLVVSFLSLYKYKLEAICGPMWVYTLHIA